MELRQLRYAIVLSEELNFRRAAKRLNISQPPLSRQIKLLEEELNTTLFVRTTKNVAITTAGHLFVKEAQKIVKRADNVTAVLANSKKNNKVSIGCMGFCNVVFMTELVLELNKKNVHAEIASFNNNTHLINALENNQVDIAFHYPMPGISENVKSIEVYKEPMVVFMNKENPLYKKPEIAIEDLLHQEYVLPQKSSNPKMIQKLHDIFDYFNIAPKIKYEISNHQSRLEMTAKGVGLTFDGISLSKLNLTNLVYRNLPKEYPAFAKVNMAYLKETNQEYNGLLEAFFKDYRTSK